VDRTSHLRSAVGLVRKKSTNPVIVARTREPENQIPGNWVLGLANKPLIFKKTKEDAMVLVNICNTCEKEPGTWRTPYLEDRAEAEAMGYYSCDSCFAAVWAGEN